MKIAVFGDSYSASSYMNPSPTWVDLLAEKHNVQNFSLSGSSLYFSVSLLLKHSWNFEKNILVVTQPGRIMIPNEHHVPQLHQRAIAGIRTIDHLEKNLTESDNFLQRYYNAAKEYFMYLQDNQYDSYIHSLMVRDAIQKVPNLIVIPAFPNSDVPGINISMHHIYIKECEGWGETEHTAKEYRDIRNCHMTKENNVIFAKKVEEWISGSPVYINVDDFESNPDNKSDYLEKLL